MESLILNGDQCLIEPGPQWNHKNIVAIYMDRHLTCKQLHLHKHAAALISANPNYAPIIVTEEMKIVGASDKNRTQLSQQLAVVNSINLAKG